IQMTGSPTPPVQPSAPQRIVAELGRPETPDETAERKAESSRKHRANQTLFNLVIALVASLGIVLFLVLVVVRPSIDATPHVDYQKLAADAQPTVSAPLASPQLPKSWSANAARLNTGSDSVVTWYIGFITPTPQYIGLIQGIEANPTWVAAQLGDALTPGVRATGSESIGGLVWAVYDQRSTSSNAGTDDYALVTTIDSSSYVLHGSADTAEFHTLATALAHQLTEAHNK
ncbi:MAG: DUF4245 domain-containing protein, partial [Lacisediminihabitans sp.]